MNLDTQKLPSGGMVTLGEDALAKVKSVRPDVRVLLQGKKRTAAVHTAPPQGLFLAKVYYR